METATYQVASKWDFDEHIRVLRAVDRITTRRRPLLRAFRILFPFILLALVFAPTLRVTETPPPVTIALTLLPWVLVIALWFGLLAWGQFYIAARRTRQLDPSVRGVLTRSLTNDGFRVDGTGQAVDLRWEGIHSAVETPEFLLIFFNKLCAYYIPKRLIQGSDLNAIRELLRSKLGERAELTGAA